MSTNFLDFSFSITGAVLKKDLTSLAASVQGLPLGDITWDDVEGLGIDHSLDTPKVFDLMEECVITDNGLRLPWHSDLMKHLVTKGFSCVLKTDLPRYGSGAINTKIVMVATPKTRQPVQLLCDQYGKFHIPVENISDSTYTSDLHIALEHLKVHDNLRYIVGTTAHDIFKQQSEKPL